MMRTAHGTGSQRESSGYTVRLAIVAAVAVTIAMPSLSAAQAPPDTPTAAFHELPLLLKLGDRITVTDDTGRELQGELIDLSPSALSVLVDERDDLQETDSAGKTRCPNGWRCSIEEQTRYDLRETEITGITQRHPDSLKDGALRGFMAGAAVGSILVATRGGGYHPGYMLAGAIFFGGLGVSVGMGVDAARAGSRVVYDTRGSSRRVSVVPLLSRDRKGIAVSLGF